MKNFIVLKNNVVKKVMEFKGDLYFSKQFASSFFEEEVIEIGDRVLVGFELHNDSLVPPRPFESWTIKNKTWIPPKVCKSSSPMIWDENVKDWVELEYT